MLRLNLSNTPDWLDLSHGVRVFVEPVSTAVKQGQRTLRDGVVAALPDGIAMRQGHGVDSHTKKEETAK